MSRKSGNGFSDKDMRKAKESRAVYAPVGPETAPEGLRSGLARVVSRYARARLTYSSVVCTHVNVACSLEPRPEPAVMIAIDMAATISPYAIVVAPLSSRANRCKSISMIHALPRQCGRIHLTTDVLRLGCAVP